MGSPWNTASQRGCAWRLHCVWTRGALCHSMRLRRSPIHTASVLLSLMQAVPIPASFGATGVPETPKCGRCKRSFGNFGKSTWSADSGSALAEVSEDETRSSLLALQMATTALQSVVSELLLAVESVCEQQDDESGDEASSPKATQLKARRIVITCILLEF